VEGTAKVTLAFDAWKEGRVAPATVEIPVIKPTPKQAGTTAEKEK
jgi:hypothetical protein